MINKVKYALRAIIPRKFVCATRSEDSYSNFSPDYPGNQIFPENQTL